VDSKDFRLLALLNENARQSFRALGRRLSLTAPAVRERLRRLEARGIVQGYWVSVVPAIFGREDLLVSFEKEWSREDAVRASNAPDVAWVAWKVEGGVTVQLWPLDADRALGNLADFLGREPTWHGTSRSGWSGSLSGIDWRVLDALLDAPLASVEPLADRTALSPKTVRKHLAGLIRSEAIFVVARLGLPADSGVLVYNLLVGGTAPFTEIKTRIGDAVLVHETAEPRKLYLFCRADSLGELTATIQALEKAPGVSDVQLTLNREMILRTDFVHRLVRERVEAKEDVRPE
jgi:DNA-binding Lrp family transcriptional regulator